MKLIEKIILDDIVKEIETLKDDFFILDRRIQYRVTGRTVRVDNWETNAFSSLYTTQQILMNLKEAISTEVVTITKTLSISPMIWRKN